MAVRGLFEQSVGTYEEEQTREVVYSLGIQVQGETFNDFTALCPFHGNRYTPSLSISKLKGTYVCFNPSCGESGNLTDLVCRLTDRNEFQAMRFISSKGGDITPDITDRLTSVLENKPDWIPFPQEVLDRLYNSMNDGAYEYMYERGFSKETLDYFKIGFSVHNEKHKDMVTVPMHAPDGTPVGLIGRSIEGKEFKNSRRLPVSKTLWNLHRAKRASSTAIVTEASFDAMRVHQAGYPGVVANLGGHMNGIKLGLLDRHFDRIIIMTDFDELFFPEECNKCPDKCKGHNAGRDLGYLIASSLPNKDLWWAATEYNVVYPHGAKDAGDLTDEEITHMIENCVPNVEYMSWTTY